jgi:hypothetical protein
MLGESWTIQSSGTTQVLRGVCFADTNTGTAVGDAGTILHTSNGGASWTVQSSQTPYSLYGVCFTDGNTGTVDGDHGTILRTTTGGVTWIKESASIPDRALLEPSYPNPFNGETNIEYRVPGTGRGEQVVLRVYDVLGREVLTLVDEVEAPGAHAAVFNAGGLASGLYYYRLQAGEMVQTRKMVLLK